MTYLRVSFFVFVEVEEELPSFLTLEVTFRRLFYLHASELYVFNVSCLVAPQRFLLLSATFTGCCLLFFFNLGNDHIADGFDEGEEEEQANEVEDVEEVSEKYGNTVSNS